MSDTFLEELRDAKDILPDSMNLDFMDIDDSFKKILRRIPQLEEAMTVITAHAMLTLNGIMPNKYAILNRLCVDLLNIIEQQQAKEAQGE